MPQISLYMDRASLDRITAAARREKKSVSAWARDRLVRETRAEWPESLVATFGALRGSALQRPPQPRLRDDVPRKHG
jgi:hypothetical protein